MQLTVTIELFPKSWRKSSTSSSFLWQEREKDGSETFLIILKLINKESST